MATLDIFNNDAFSLASLTGTIVDIPRVPTLLGDMKLFAESSMNTTVAMIERTGGSLNLVPTSARGGVGQPVTRDARKLIPLVATHLQQEDTILADQVQGVRAFGKETEVDMVSKVVAKSLIKMKGNLDLTIEYQRIGALKGLVLDADGVTPILDVYAAFGMTQAPVAWNIASAASSIDPVALTRTLKASIRNKLGGRGFTGIRVLCSNAFLLSLVTHAKMKDAYARWQEGAFLRTDSMDTDLIFNNVKFTVYDYTIGGVDAIGAGWAYAYPEGVSDMFHTIYAPADYMETVNTEGVPYYAKQEVMRFDRGISIESQSNPLCFNKLPEAVIPLYSGATLP